MCSKKVSVCLIQDSPEFFNKERIVEKIRDLSSQYARQGNQLIVFPESFIPGYPRGFSFGTRVGSRSEEGRELYQMYHQQSVNLQSDDRADLESIARDNNIYLVIGITEKDHSGSLYCSMLYISPEKGLMGVHRKIKPTGQERVIWAEASGDSLIACQTKIGRLGGLICWENYMPLARVSMYLKGVEIYIAPTADARSSWTTTMQHIALEGRCFVLGCNMYFNKSMYPSAYQHLVADEPEEICPGGSLIVAPNGKILSGPVFGKAAALTATIDLNEVVKNKLDFDPIGHYARNDIFDFKVNNQPDVIVE